MTHLSTEAWEDHVHEKAALRAEIKRLRAENGDLLAWESHLKAEIERLRAALQRVLDSPQGCDCLPSSGCNRAKIFEVVRQALKPTPGRTE